jgi:hypothetical protein
LFATTGPLDEAIRSVNEHWDVSLMAAAAGARLALEPSAIVGHRYPRPFPLDLQSLPFFRFRWDRERNRAGFAHFQEKWGLRPDDPELIASEHWHNDRRDVIFRHVFPAEIYRHGLRRLRRALAGAGQTSRSITT